MLGLKINFFNTSANFCKNHKLHLEITTEPAKPICKEFIVITERKTFLSLLDSSDVLMRNIETLFKKKNKRRLIEGILLNYFLYPQQRKSIFKKSLFQYFILMLKSQTFSYSEILYRPATGHRRSFHICRRSNKK